MTNLEPRRAATSRTYLMCPPAHFAVTYAINPWMRPEEPADPGLAMRQWERLRAGLPSASGTRSSTIEPVPGLPDMVFAANGATVVNGSVLGARFRHPERAAEARAYLEWFRAHGWPVVREPAARQRGRGRHPRRRADAARRRRVPQRPGAPPPSWRTSSACRW